MFPGMFMRKPDKAVALKQLKSHVAMFGAWVAVIRVTPYILHYLSAIDHLKINSDALMPTLDSTKFLS
ncbi:mitochondrial import receptor subunit tom6 like protein [Quercus suber]|uniref:Mitochondrial import receptor subunit tom6 like protein n=1 Tax=Quercus suber TaxID=58331 RepID=A0AAW0JUF2_QUESU